MLIELESWQGDRKFYGPSVGERELKEQMRKVNMLFDRENDNFAALLCRLYGWMEVDTPDAPAYIYDRDTGMLLKINFSERGPDM